MGKESDKLQRADPTNAKEIAAKQVCQKYLCVLYFFNNKTLYIWIWYIFFALSSKYENWGTNMKIITELICL